MYQLNPILEGSESVRMLMGLKAEYNRAKNNKRYHDSMIKFFADKMREIVDRDGAMMDKTIFNSLRRSQRHHIKASSKFQDIIENKLDELNDVRMSLGLLK